MNKAMSCLLALGLGAFVTACAEEQRRKFVTAEVVSKYDLQPEAQCDIEKYSEPLDETAEVFAHTMPREQALIEFSRLAKEFGKVAPPKTPCRVEIEVGVVPRRHLMPEDAANHISVLLGKEEICLNFRNWFGEKDEAWEFPNERSTAFNPKGVEKIVIAPGVDVVRSYYHPACYDRAGNLKGFRNDQ